MPKENEKKEITRPPVVVVMGHIDHGKSTLLDYIRKTNIVETEAGGITQRISAYEFCHKENRITFIDTPGHESFSKMRERGAKIADIAILIVSAEDGVKPQTIEAWKTIQYSQIPCLVAINKIDKPGANVEKTKIELAENEIYLENYGGKVPFVLISAKIGTGIEELLSLIDLLAEMENFTGQKEVPASGFVVEAHLDPKRGIEATLIIKNGTLKKGMTVTVEDSLCSSNILENFLGKNITEASFSSPIRLTGFNKMPRVGASFQTFKNKREAEKSINQWIDLNRQMENREKINDSGNSDLNNKKIIPIILKADIAGSLEAIEKEIAKIKNPQAEFRIVQKGVGPICESDIKTAKAEETIIIGFNVKSDKCATETASQRDISINFFNIIYKLTEWLEEEMEKRRPRVETVETAGQAKILKVFSKTKEKQVLGARVLEGKIFSDKMVKINRRDFEIGRGKIVNLEKNKTKVKEVETGTEFGLLLESKIEIVPGDVLESFNIYQK